MGKAHWIVVSEPPRGPTLWVQVALGILGTYLAFIVDYPK